ncbi:hypothetical protein CPB83DRAFT_854813, partial [Crepidotus variabilis]
MATLLRRLPFKLSDRLFTHSSSEVPWLDRYSTLVAWRYANIWSNFFYLASWSVTLYFLRHWWL